MISRGEARQEEERKIGRVTPTCDARVVVWSSSIDFSC